MSNGKINVLLVEDSPVACELLRHILHSDPQIHVIAAARNGEEAMQKLEECKPDVVTMDIHMPGMDGFETTRRIMETQPVPVVIVSASFDPADVTNTFRAMEAGAVAACEKPPGPHDPTHDPLARRLINTVKAMSEVRVIKRWSRNRTTAAQQPPAVPVTTRATGVQLLVIGASTGGPPVLQTILKDLPKPFPVPILIVQHISAGFVQGLADWLTNTTGMSVQLAAHGDLALSGRVYLAPDGLQMRVERTGRLICLADPPENGLRPSVSALFRSVAQTFGPSAIGVLLTGMGRDGAEELRLMRERGAITFAQDKDSSIVHGMPGEAIKLGAAKYVLPPERIATVIRELFGPQISLNSPTP